MGLPKDSGLELHSKWPKGKLNLITDVPGVKVANVTIQDGKEVNTGVTAILPHTGDIFHDKVMAGVSVINGFGKSLGLVQIDELGTIETPIVMTNTLSVGTAAEALTRYMLVRNDDIGVKTGTVNCVVTECNDGRLNDIRGLHVKAEHVNEALAKAEKDGEVFEEGAVGGGTGMCCLGLKGGIGSSSRVVAIDGKDYTVGAIVMSNFGGSGNLVIGGDHIGKRIKERMAAEDKKDLGSIIMIIATDAPISDRQLRRVAKRATVSLGRCGSYLGNGSGDIAVAFSTGNRVPHYTEGSFIDMKMMDDEKLDVIFESAVEAVEESVISSMYHAKTTKGVRGNIYYGLREFL